MGLDMYLYADIYVGKDEFSKSKGFEDNPRYKKLIEALDLDETIVDGYGFTVHAPIGTWRKANAIHKWFIDNCANGIDDCQEFSVGKHQLIELKDVCEKVIESQHLDVADDLLPTGSGFFFGSTVYDEWYYSNVEYTIKIIDKAMSIPSVDNFIYRASW